MPITDEANKIATSFMDRFFQGVNPELDDIETLCTLCINQENIDSNGALHALYGVIIEGLSNDFSKRGMELGNKILAEIIWHVRHLPTEKEFDSLLNCIELRGRNSFLQNYPALLSCPPLLYKERQKIKKIILLSRVTVGADVVLGSIFIQRLFQAFPNAEIVMMGPSHIPQIFHGFSNFSHCHVEYNRHGSLTDRITGWSNFHQLTKQEFSGLSTEETLIVDPDSRLTQLGLLPLGPQGRTRFFPSRHLESTEQFSSLAHMANNWCDQQFGKNQFVWPQIALKSSLCKSAKTFKQGLKSPFFLVLSFGVGNNEKKRLTDQFEKQLLLSLLEMKNIVILLDSGTQDSGLQKVKNLLEFCKEYDYKTDFLREEELENKTGPFLHGIIGFRGSIGSLGSFIAEADGFFGYDSCCQHLASALDIPAVIAFMGAPNDRFYSRWCSQGENNRTHTIRVHEEKKNNAHAINTLINRILSQFKKIRDNS